MHAILAIDAAWTATEPSGVALLAKTRGRWHCRAVAPSYAQFETLADGVPVDWTQRPRGSRPDLDRLLAASERLLGAARVDLIAADMPLSLQPITARRAADTAVSRAFGARGCAVHSPSATRPGPVADALRAAAAGRGFPLATTAIPVGATPALLEVYPHPALLRLLAAKFRVQYKVARSRKYWPELAPDQRRQPLLEQFRRIRDALAQAIDGPLPALPAIEDVRTLASLKAIEDALDALVCGWVGMRYLAGACRPYGDGTAAIWIPE